MEMGTTLRVAPPGPITQYLAVMVFMCLPIAFAFALPLAFLTFALAFAFASLGAGGIHNWEELEYRA